MSTTEEDGSENDWERLSQTSASRISQSIGSASEIGSVNGSVCGEDVDALTEDWALIGPIGEDGTMPEYDITSLTSMGRPSTPASSHTSDTTLAERLCAGPFGSKTAAMRRRQAMKKRTLGRPLNMAMAGAHAPAPAQGAPTEIS